MRDLILKPYLAQLLGCISWRQGVTHFMSSDTFTSAINPTLCGILSVNPGLLLQYQRQIEFNPPCPMATGSSNMGLRYWFYQCVLLDVFDSPAKFLCLAPFRGTAHNTICSHIQLL
jgi:hypothetical protein